MKIVFQFIAVLCLSLLTVPVSAQGDDGSKAVISRYESVTGLDKLTESDMESVMMEVLNKVQGMSMPMKMVMKQPGKMRVEMQMGGQNILTVVDGDNGWVSVPGQGVQSMPAEAMEQVKEQIKSVNQNYRWTPQEYDFKMEAEVKQGGKTLQGIRMTHKKPQPQISNVVVYFDKETGVVVYSTMDISDKVQTVAARMTFSDYKTFGKFKIPSVFKMTVDGKELMTMEIKTLEYNYSTTDDMFAKPL